MHKRQQQIAKLVRNCVVTVTQTSCDRRIIFQPREQKDGEA